jgi:hypothetical protein
MAPTIPQILRQFKADVATAIAPETIVRICCELGHNCRHRILDPVATVHVFLIQILHGNTACTALPRLAGLFFSAAAYCSARKRLPLSLFQRLLQYVCDRLFPEIEETGRWHGHRTWSLDGSSFSMSDSPALQAHFGQSPVQAKGCGFPVAHILALFHAGTGLLVRVVAAPLRTSDLRHAPSLHPEMAKGDIVIADRGFGSYAYLALLFLRKIHAVCRSHQNKIVSFRIGRKHTHQAKAAKGLPRSRYVRRLGRLDQIVEYSKPKTKPAWMDADTWKTLPETLLLRELRFATPQRGHRTRVITLVTTLLDSEKYPATELAQLYLSRWQIEVNFRHLKTTMGMEVLHCQSVEGVIKELHMFAIAYNLVRLVMLEASRRQKAPLDRISFIDALRWLRDAKANTILNVLLINPARPDRIEPRVIKRRLKEYTLMKKPRPELRKDLLRNKLAA